MNSDSISTTLPAPELGVSETNGKWNREYQAFLRLKPQLMGTHAGQYVVIHNGLVVDNGPDDVELALKFFAQQGNVPVHIGLVTDLPEAAVRIPHYRQLSFGGEG